MAIDLANGDVVLITNGPQKESMGVVLRGPDRHVNRRGYVVVTLNCIYGEWISSADLLKLPVNDRIRDFRQRIYTERLKKHHWDGYIPPDVSPLQFLDSVVEINPTFNAENKIENGFIAYIDARYIDDPYITLSFKGEDGPEFSYICLNKPCYVPIICRRHLTSEEKNLFIMFMNSKVKLKSSSLTARCWDMAVATWEIAIVGESFKKREYCRLMFALDEKGNRIMPDYTYLPADI